MMYSIPESVFSVSLRFYKYFSALVLITRKVDQELILILI